MVCRWMGLPERPATRPKGAEIVDWRGMMGLVEARKGRREARMRVECMVG